MTRTTLPASSHVHRLCSGARHAQRRLATKPPGSQVLAGDECLLEIPRLAAGFVMQAGVITGDELKFFRKSLYLERRSQRGLVQIGHVTILLGHGDAISPGD